MRSVRRMRKGMRYGWDPVMFVQEAKTDAVLSGCIPGYIEKMLENDEKTANIYGKALPDNYPCAENSSDTLLFVGVDARYNDVASVKGANELLLKAGVKADILKDEPDSGYDMWFLTGNTAEAQQKAEECAGCSISTRPWWFTIRRICRL